MQICVTKKLADKMKLQKLPLPEKTDGFYTWRANITDCENIRLLVFMNDASRYVLVVGVNKRLKSIYSQLPKIFEDTLRSALLMEQINPEVIKRYITEMGEVEFVANSGRAETSWLNKACDNAWFGAGRYTENAALSVYASHLYVGPYESDERSKPNSIFAGLLSRYGIPVKKSRAFDFEVRLDLEGDNVVRKIRVPSNITFIQLHKIIQKSYNWTDSHLFRFCFYKNEKFDYYAKAEIELVCNEYELETAPDAILMHDMLISDYFPKWKKCVYNYDYGDDWFHHIELTDVIDDYSGDLPQLLLGTGDAPPEDVGGVGGFVDFLNIISDQKNEDYENMMEWAQSQWWKLFDFESTARKVKSSLWW